jgi:hypothetical protein
LNSYLTNFSGRLKRPSLSSFNIMIALSNPKLKQKKFAFDNIVSVLGALSMLEFFNDRTKCMMNRPGCSQTHL